MCIIKVYTSFKAVTDSFVTVTRGRPLSLALPRRSAVATLARPARLAPCRDMKEFTAAYAIGGVNELTQEPLEEDDEWMPDAPHTFGAQMRAQPEMRRARIGPNGEEQVPVPAAHQRRASRVPAACQPRASAVPAPCQPRASAVPAPCQRRASAVPAPCQRRASEDTKWC